MLLRKFVRFVVITVLFLRLDCCGIGLVHAIEIITDGPIDVELDQTVGQLRPSDLPPHQLFTDWTNPTTMHLKNPNNKTITMQTSSIHQVHNKNSVVGEKTYSAPAEIVRLSQLIDRDSIDRIVTMVREYGDSLDEDPDSVDGMTTYEVYIDSVDLGDNPIKVRDRGHDTERNQFRENVRRITQPLLRDIITPFVQKHFAPVCYNPDQPSRHCTPCYSLIRRYRYGERQSHAAHHDGHAFVTVVVSLSDYGHDYNGGLFVATGHGDRHFVELYRGDAVAHQSTLYHGVQVFPRTINATQDDNIRPTERYSWILWYRDSTDCHDYSYEWFKDGAMMGDPVYQELHAGKLVGNQTLPNMEAQVLQLSQAAAEHGVGTAAVKMARAHLKLLPMSLLPVKNVTEALRYYNLAIQSHHPDGYYGVAVLLIAEALEVGSRVSEYDQLLRRAVYHLEKAALLGHAFAMFNLGMVHVFGYGIEQIDVNLGVEWFIQSGLPEGFAVAAASAAAIGDTARHQTYWNHAVLMGYNKPWRRQARQHTGSGGAGGVDLNMPWPAAKDGRQPPVF